MTVLCNIQDIPEEDARGFDLDGESLVVIRRDGQIFVYRNWCPHLGIELNFMPDVFLDSDQTFVQCANHGALFRIEDGYCVSGPCAQQSLVSVPFRVVADEIHIDALPEPGTH